MTSGKAIDGSKRWSSGPYSMARCPNRPSAPMRDAYHLNYFVSNYQRCLPRCGHLPWMLPLGTSIRFVFYFLDRPVFDPDGWVKGSNRACVSVPIKPQPLRKPCRAPFRQDSVRLGFVFIYNPTRQRSAGEPTLNDSLSSFSRSPHLGASNRLALDIRSGGSIERQTLVLSFFVFTTIFFLQFPYLITASKILIATTQCLYLFTPPLEVRAEAQI